MSSTAAAAAAAASRDFVVGWCLCSLGSGSSSNDGDAWWQASLIGAPLLTRLYFHSLVSSSSFHAQTLSSSSDATRTSKLLHSHREQ